MDSQDVAPQWNKVTSSALLSEVRRESTSVEMRLFLTFLLLPTLMQPCLVWLRMPPLPQTSLSEFPTSLEDALRISLFTWSESLSSPAPSEQAAKGGWENLAAPCFLNPFDLRSDRSICSSEEESLTPSSAVGSSLSSDAGNSASFL